MLGTLLHYVPTIPSAYRTPSPQHLPPLPILYSYLVFQPSNCPRLPPRVLLYSFPVRLYPRIELFFGRPRPTFRTRDIFEYQKKKVLGRRFRRIMALRPLKEWSSKLAIFTGHDGPASKVRVTHVHEDDLYGSGICREHLPEIYWKKVRRYLG